MKRLIVAALLSSAIALPAVAALKQGEKAPDFSAKASLAGKEFSFTLKDATKKGPVVVYFYPAAFTRGCNAEAHAFAENAEKFAAAHATIIGVSQDSIERLNAFSSDPEYCAGKFPVASDPNGTITRSYGLNNIKLPENIKNTRGEEVGHDASERTTFVITSDDKIIATLSSADDKVTPAEHAEKSLALVQQLNAKK